VAAERFGIGDPRLRKELAKHGNDASGEKAGF